jgi:amino acid transporter
MTSDNRNLQASAAQAADEPDRLPRVLGLFDATMIVVGSIIGSGIFLKVSAVDSKLAAYGFGAIMGVWLFVGLITLCGALALCIFANPSVVCRHFFGAGLSSG